MTARTTPELQQPGATWYAALDRYEAELTPPRCEAESVTAGRCERTATWAVRLGATGAGLCCDPCKTDIDNARFGKPHGLQWVRL